MAAYLACQKLDPVITCGYNVITGDAAADSKNRVDFDQETAAAAGQCC